MARVYYDRQGHVRGYGTSLRGGILLWWLGVLLFPLALVLVVFPRAVMASRLSPAAKLAAIAVVWGALVALGAIVGAQA